MLKIIVATCSEQYAGTNVLFACLETGLPAGLFASPAVVSVVWPTSDVWSSDVLPYPCAIVGRRYTW